MVTKNSNIAVLITAAGSSTRIGEGIKKEYLPFNNGTVLSACAKTFLNAFLKSQKYKLSDFVITCPPGGQELCQKALLNDSELAQLQEDFKKTEGLSIRIVEGSSTRQKSVLNGLKQISGDTDIVLIHDGARPFVTEKLILEGTENALKYGASVPGITPTDTQKRINKDGFIEEHLIRSQLTAVQTPQCFNFLNLLEAHFKAAQESKEYTDDTEIWGKYYPELPVKVFAGDVNNIKITYKADLEKLVQK